MAEPFDHPVDPFVGLDGATLDALQPSQAFQASPRRRSHVHRALSVHRGRPPCSAAPESCPQAGGSDGPFDIAPSGEKSGDLPQVMTGAGVIVDLAQRDQRFDEPTRLIRRRPIPRSHRRRPGSRQRGQRAEAVAVRRITGTGVNADSYLDRRDSGIPRRLEDGPLGRYRGHDRMRGRRRQPRVTDSTTLT